jgi:hypothetical protein
VKAIIVPGLVVTEVMFEAAADALAAHVPDFAPLTWERFTNPSRWTRVPAVDGSAYKAELTLLRSPDRTLKLNLWSLPDRRGGQRPMPHNHPWSFRSVIVLGGYTEDRYMAPVDGGAPPAQRELEHRSPTVNELGRGDYHEVTEIHDPHNTLTLMICGPGRTGQWGYLDTSTGDYVPAPSDPHFRAKLRHLNPHRSVEL